MFSQVLRKEILCLSNFKNLPPNIYFVVQRNKSTSGSLSENMQILKPVSKSSSAVLRIKTINKAMKAYLERSKQYENFLKEKNEQFEIGRQHLANIMGLEVANLTQDDIDKAIAYLLPSGLFEKKARPMMKPPLMLYPKEKAALFDNSGRPFSPYFYTQKGNYNAALHTIVGKFHELDEFEDKMIAKGILEVPQSSLLNLAGGEWINLDEMREMFMEPIVEHDHTFLVTTLNRLVNHPYSFRCKELFQKYHKEFTDVRLESIPELMYDTDGRPYMESEGRRKWSEATVIVRGNGTGKIMINGTDIFYFVNLHDREQIMYPLEFTDMLGLVDIEVKVRGPGTKANAGAIRLGISRCLRSFVEPNVAERMRLGGLLTEDCRRRGRKKPGQKGCRAKYTWKKR